MVCEVVRGQSRRSFLVAEMPKTDFAGGRVSRPGRELGTIVVLGKTKARDGGFAIEGKLQISLIKRKRATC
jgi:hypothetical protein